jgi:hypothetical protein
MRTWYELLDTDYESEQARLRMEARDSIVLKKEIEAMQHMDIAQLKTLAPETPIMDTRELDSLEKSLDIEEEGKDAGSDAGMDLGGAGGGDMGGGGMPDLGGLGGSPGGGEEPAPDSGGEPPSDLGAPPGGPEPAGGAETPAAPTTPE